MNRRPIGEMVLGYVVFFGVIVSVIFLDTTATLKDIWIIVILSLIYARIGTANDQREDMQIKLQNSFRE